MLVILSASIMIQNKSLKTANLFFQTFQKNSENDWFLVRSYIEAGVAIANIGSLRIKQKL
ncbi:hypothetical protein CN285_19565 [Bacillus cereus]|uniref:hypothetical protein n=1 Tax=Bacillus paramycoides TaxID=2026194 RepID=UPI000BF848A5|nr:hypothetical protein [Bacillus paramycoides]PFD37827.1 hypothetical protein CN285_19565 [Bacillus cereus]